MSQWKGHVSFLFLALHSYARLLSSNLTACSNIAKATRRSIFPPWNKNVVSGTFLLLDENCTLWIRSTLFGFKHNNTITELLSKLPGCGKVTSSAAIVICSMHYSPVHLFLRTHKCIFGSNMLLLMNHLIPFADSLKIFCWCVAWQLP